MNLLKNFVLPGLKVINAPITRTRQIEKAIKLKETLDTSEEFNKYSKHQIVYF